MYQLRYLKQAQSDFIKIKIYLAKQSGSNAVASRYVAKLRQQCRELAELPGTMGRARPELMVSIPTDLPRETSAPDAIVLRSIPHGNYVIFFRYNGASVEIVSIIEGHRDIEGLSHQLQS